MPTLKKPQSKPYRITDGVSQSMLSSFLICRQRCRFELDGWENAFNKTSAARGDLFHRVLEKWYGFKEAYPTEILKEPYHNIMKVEMSNWEKEQYKKAKSEDIEDTLNFIEVMFPAYVKYWTKHDVKLDWCGNLEMVFDVMWQGFRLRGKMDGLPQLNKSWWLFETKTKAQIDEEGLVDQLAFDFQNLFYLTVCDVLGKPGRGVIYNVIRKPQHKTLDALRADVEKRPDHFFKRYEIAYPASTVLHFKRELLFKLNDFKAWVEGTIPTYRNEAACFGRIRCPYLKACSSGTMVGFTQTRKLFRELDPTK